MNDFIHNKAIEFAKQGIAITFLVFKETEQGNILVGYYALANKFVAVSDKFISKTLIKRITRFSQYDTLQEKYLISMPLIAQLGKNCSDKAKVLEIDGAVLLELACQNIRKVQQIVGGKITYIECASNTKLYDFYTRNGFVKFGEREKEQEELSDSPVLVQMLKYFK